MPNGSIAEWVSHESVYRYIALSKNSKAFFEGKLGDDGSVAGQRTFVDLETGNRKFGEVVYRNEIADGDWYEWEQGTNAAPKPMARLDGMESKIVVCNGKKFDPTSDLSGTWEGSNKAIAYFFQDGDFLSIVHTKHFLDCKKTERNAWQVHVYRTWRNCITEMSMMYERVSPDYINAVWVALDSRCDLKKGQSERESYWRLKAMGTGDSVFITEFRIFDEFQPIDPTDFIGRELVIDHSQNNITFGFSSSFAPSATNFYYQLEGFDKGWFMASMQRTATYTNLDGGSYTFKVKAVDVEGNEIHDKAQFRLKVRPPFYKTWWFILSAALVSFALIRFVFRYRLRQQLEKEAIRQRIARDLHDEVGSTLTTISILSESVLRNVELDGEKARLSGIGEKARSAMSSMSDIVWAVNPQNDSMEKVVERMTHFASETLENAGISPVIDIEKEVFNLVLPMEKRKDFYLFFKEATTNVAKHSRASKAVFSMKKENGHLVFELQDDGIGLPETPENSLGGNGLKNMRARAAALGADFSIKNTTERGAFVSLSIPMK
jgi:signal transduction histidine kinase